jgi:hypothetical protein
MAESATESIRLSTTPRMGSPFSYKMHHEHAGRPALARRSADGGASWKSPPPYSPQLVSVGRPVGGTAPRAAQRALLPLLRLALLVVQLSEQRSQAGGSPADSSADFSGSSTPAVSPAPAPAVPAPRAPVQPPSGIIMQLCRFVRSPAPHRARGPAAAARRVEELPSFTVLDRILHLSAAGKLIWVTVKTQPEDPSQLTRPTVRGSKFTSSVGKH